MALSPAIRDDACQVHLGHDANDEGVTWSSGDDRGHGQEVSPADHNFDDALGVLGDTGPEYLAFGGRISFANHGPMVIEALSTMGREGAFLDWAQQYRPRLEGRPVSRAKISSSDWPEALGDMSRVRDWADLFDAELAESPWTEVLNRWFPRLAPGMVGGVHGAIRTAHGVRSLGRQVTALRLHELAEGMAYWAAQYESLPRSQGPESLLPSQAIAQLEQLDLADRTGWIRFTDPIRKLSTLSSFAGAADLVDTSRDSSTIVADLARSFAAILITNNASVNPRALCHGLTAGTASRMMWKHLSANSTEAALRYGWQTTAAFFSALVLEPPAATVETPTQTVDEIIDEALACPDEHAVKVTEACLREHTLDPDPVYLVAAVSTTRRLNEVGLNLY